MPWTTARAVLVVGALTAGGADARPWPGLEQVVRPQRQGGPRHRLPSSGPWVAVSFLAFPRMLRNDLAIAAIMLDAPAAEVAQLFTADRSASIGDLLADTTRRVDHLPTPAISKICAP